MYVLPVTTLSSPLPLAAQPHLAGTILLAPSLPVVFLILLATIFIIGMVLRGGQFLHRRRAALHAMAKRVGLRPWPENSLPRGLSFQGTLFQSPTKMANIFEGALNHNEVVILDFHKQEAEASWARTILAVKTRNPVRIPPNLETRRSGPWQLIYVPVALGNTSVLMDVDHLELLIKNSVQ